jgi:hypothetical protein
VVVVNLSNKELCPTVVSILAKFFSFTHEHNRRHEWHRKSVFRFIGRGSRGNTTGNLLNLKENQDGEEQFV